MATNATTVDHGDGTYDLYDGEVALLTNATMPEVQHFLSYGHAECEQGCDICKGGE